MDERGHSDPVADLESRWKQERSSQLTLQLAEEHRRNGDLDGAIEVLRTGLEHHPRHVSARVALGRYLLESGEVSAAKAALESVVDDDPTHLVANKLLISIEVELGDSERAQRRLDLYELLNSADPEMDGLKEKVAAVGGEVDEQIEAAPPPLGGRSSSGEMIQGAVAAPAVESTAAEKAQEPFGQWSVSLDRSQYRAALLREGIFQIAPTELESEGTGEEESEAQAQKDPGEATVTLGRLYLEQGHRGDAEKVFRTVLESDPDNDEARAGLREAAGEAAGLRATDLVDRDTLASAVPVERKRLVLESYRELLRTTGDRS